MFTAPAKYKPKSLKKIEVERPEGAKKYWTGIKHSDLRKEFFLQMTSKKWSAEEMAYAVSTNGAEVAIRFDIEIPNTPVPKLPSHLSEDKLYWTYSIGIASGNDRRRALTIFYGLACETCSIPFGVLTKEKHTHGLSLEGTVKKILDNYWDAILTIPELLENLKYGVTTNDTWGLMRDWCEGTRRNSFLWRKLGTMNRELKNWEDGEGHLNYWSVLCAASMVVKEMSPLKQMDVMLKLQALIQSM